MQGDKCLRVWMGSEAQGPVPNGVLSLGLLPKVQTPTGHFNCRRLTMGMWEAVQAEVCWGQAVRTAYCPGGEVGAPCSVPGG